MFRGWPEHCPARACPLASLAGQRFQNYNRRKIRRSVKPASKETVALPEGGYWCVNGCGPGGPRYPLTPEATVVPQKQIPRRIEALHRRSLSRSRDACHPRPPLTPEQSEARAKAVLVQEILGHLGTDLEDRDAIARNFLDAIQQATVRQIQEFVQRFRESSRHPMMLLRERQADLKIAVGGAKQDEADHETPQRSNPQVEAAKQLEETVSQAESEREIARSSRGSR